jgi:hypothetical protein
MLPEQGAPLLRRRLSRGRAHRAQVAEVLAPGPDDGVPALGPLPVELDEKEAQGRGEKERGGQEAAGLSTCGGVAHGGHQDDRSETSQHREGVQQRATGALR